MPVERAWAPSGAFGKELVFCDGGVVLSGGGVAPSEVMISVERFNERGAAPRL